MIEITAEFLAQHKTRLEQEHANALAQVNAYQGALAMTNMLIAEKARVLPEALVPVAPMDAPAEVPANG